jgi:hypothetical protein
MPDVKKGESQKDYVARCIPTVLKEGTAKDQKQAAAICFSKYSQHQKKMRKTKGEQIVEALGKWLNRNGKKPPTT